jgi:TadE-like protein
VVGKLKHFFRAEDGTTIIEFALTGLLFFTLLFGVIEFTYAMYQWNAASKAMQYGARIAAVSRPLAGGMVSWDPVDDGTVSNPLDGYPAYDITCVLNGASVSCTPAGSVVGTVSADALYDIVYGRGTNHLNGCPPNPPRLGVGMCHLFSRITPDKIQVRYQNTGLGYAGRPGGAVPTITVSLRQDAGNELFFEDLNIAPPA